MDQVHVIRHKVLVEGLSARKVAREMGLSRNTVRRYFEPPAPVRNEQEARKRPVWEKVRARLEALLAESPRWTGGKQRLTATRLHAMLREEGHEVGVTVVKEAVAEWKRRRREVFVPLVYPPGDLAQVDFFEVLVTLAGQLVKAWLFVMRLMHSGRDFAWLYRRQDQVSFLDGHVRAFQHFACVPQRIAYDNLRAAVAKHLVGSERQLTVRFEALASHYLFEPCFCRPRTGHDKGGVEARGKAIRWQHLVPIPEGDDLGAIAGALVARLDAAHDAERFVVDRAQSLPLPPHHFDPRKTLFATVTSRSLVHVEGAYYSVPCAWAGLEVTARVGAENVVLCSSVRPAPRRTSVSVSANAQSTTDTTCASWRTSRKRCDRSPPSSSATSVRHSLRRGARSSTRMGRNRPRASSPRCSVTSRCAESTSWRACSKTPSHAASHC